MPNATWSVVLVQPVSNAIQYELTTAKSLSLTMSAGEGASFSFSLDGNDPGAKHIFEMFTDVIVYRNSEKVYRGRIVSAPQSGDSTNCSISVSTVDYKSMLKRKFITSATSASGTAESIAWSFINTAQNRSNGNWAITRGVNQVTATSFTTYSVTAGTSVADAIDTLSQTNSAVNGANAFEWDIDPELVFRVYSPTRGRRQAAFTADFGGSVLSYDSSFDPNGYANAIYVQGSTTYIAGAVTDEGRQPPPGGLFELYVNDTNLTTTSLVDQRAFWLGTFNGNLALSKTYNCELSNAFWNGPDDCWIGDFVNLDIRHGNLNVQRSDVRVKDMAINVDVNGYEGVAIGVGWSAPARWDELNRMSNQMLVLRRDLLHQRSMWYLRTRDALYQEYLRELAINGEGAYETNASKQRLDDFDRGFNNGTI